MKRVIAAIILLLCSTAVRASHITQPGTGFGNGTFGLSTGLVTIIGANDTFPTSQPYIQVTNSTWPVSGLPHVCVDSNATLGKFWYACIGTNQSNVNPDGYLQESNSVTRWSSAGASNVQYFGYAGTFSNSIQSAASGDTVYFWGGTHTIVKPLDVPTGVKIWSAPNTTILSLTNFANSGEANITIHTNTTISGLLIAGGGSSGKLAGAGGNGLICVQGGGNYFEDMTVTNTENVFAFTGVLNTSNRIFNCDLLPYGNAIKYSALTNGLLIIDNSRLIQQHTFSGATPPVVDPLFFISSVGTANVTNFTTKVSNCQLSALSTNFGQFFVVSNGRAGDNFEFNNCGWLNSSSLVSAVSSIIIRGGYAENSTVTFTATGGGSFRFEGGAFSRSNNGTNAYTLSIPLDAPTNIAPFTASFTTVVANTTATNLTGQRQGVIFKSTAVIAAAGSANLQFTNLTSGASRSNGLVGIVGTAYITLPVWLSPNDQFQIKTNFSGVGTSMTYDGADWIGY